MKLMNKIEVLGFTIDTVLNYSENFRDSFLINTINPHSYCLARDDKVFKEALQKSNVLLPDGVGIVFAVRFLTGKRIKRISGSDLHKYLLDIANKNSYRVFYLGSTSETLNRIELKIKKEYPNVEFNSYSPPFKSEFTSADNQKIVNSINSFNANILFVGMTAPKQEKWAFQNKDLLNVEVIASIGAVFDFYAETVIRPSVFWQNIGFEWLPRLIREPQRLWRRTFISTPNFLFDVIKLKIRKSNIKSSI